VSLFPSQSGIGCLNHYTQLTNCPEFCFQDLSSFEKIGTSSPPVSLIIPSVPTQYPLDKVTTKVAVFHGENDFVGDVVVSFIVSTNSINITSARFARTWPQRKVTALTITAKTLFMSIHKRYCVIITFKKE